MEPNAASLTTHLTSSSLVSMLVIAIVACAAAAYAVRTVIVGRRHDARAEREGGTVLLNLWVMEAFYWVLRVPGRVFAKLGIHPDAITWTSLVLSLACIPSAAMGHFSVAGVFFLIGSAFDALDGMVARQLGVASDAGEMLDAVIDRYADAAPLFGLALFYRFSVWQMSIPLIAMLGSLMVSYNRAKAEAMGLKLPGGLMRRHERIAYIGGALVFAPELSPWLGSPWGAVHPATLAIIALVGMVGHIAAVRLAIAARKELVRLGRGAGGTRDQSQS
jgi:CDP-diacylglycerol--glycerol-3-phosphate 3-phosphatidyltransferase